MHLYWLRQGNFKANLLYWQVDMEQYLFAGNVPATLINFGEIVKKKKFVFSFCNSWHRSLCHSLVRLVVYGATRTNGFLHLFIFLLLNSSQNLQHAHSASIFLVEFPSSNPVVLPMVAVGQPGQTHLLQQLFVRHPWLRVVQI